jgi:hypothetical protein
MGCDSSGFFSLFSGQSAQCGPVNNQIQQMRANLDQITTSLERLRGGGFGGADRDNQRRSVLTGAGAEQLRPAICQRRARPGNFLDNLFGNNNSNPPPSADLGPQSGTFRTVCVRTCDGAYFPISFATVPALSRRREDLQGAVPGGGSDPVRLSQSRRRHEPGGLDQRPALFGAAECVSLPHRVQSVLRLQGRRPDLVRRAEIIDDKAAAEQQGDIIVTEESAKKMSQPPAKTAPGAEEGAAPATTAASTPRPPASGPPAAAPDPRTGKSTSRSVRWDRPSSPRADLYPSNASADPRPARDTSVSSGSGSGLPVSRKRLVIG